MSPFRRPPRLVLVSLVAAFVVVALVVTGVVFFLRARSAPAGFDTADLRPPACDGPGRTITKPLPVDVVRDTQWEATRPRDDATYDLTGVTSTAYPATRSVFEVGADAPARRTCIVGGTVLGQAEDDKTWQYYHDEWNAGCVKVIARGWAHVRGLRCDNVEDGIVVKESSPNANNMNIYISGTYLSKIRDDCLENDYTVGGLLYDNLWEACHTGISERPWDDEWETPEDETLVLDRMLIGLYETPNEEDGETVMGHNSIFKWSPSGGRVVIKCSIFKLESKSINGVDSMEMPPGTVVDDSDCPDNPSTIVWLGRGKYPGETAGMRVVKDEDVWTDAVTAWKDAHGH
jgi:hypothetical protein